MVICLWHRAGSLRAFLRELNTLGYGDEGDDLTDQQLDPIPVETSTENPVQRTITARLEQLCLRIKQLRDASADKDAPWMDKLRTLVLLPASTGRLLLSKTR